MKGIMTDEFLRQIGLDVTVAELLKAAGPGFTLGFGVPRKDQRAWGPTTKYFVTAKSGWVFPTVIAVPRQSRRWLVEETGEEKQASRYETWLGLDGHIYTGWTNEKRPILSVRELTVDEVVTRGEKGDD